jgi:hypothetical protein
MPPILIPVHFIRKLRGQDHFCPSNYPQVGGTGPPAWRERVLDILSSRDERRAAEASRQAKQTQLERLKALFVEGDMEMAEYRRQRDRLRGELKALASPKETQVLDAGQFLEDMARLWEVAALEDRHEMLRAIFAKVWVDRATQRITGVEVYPEFVPAFLQVPGLERVGALFEIGGQVIGGFEVGERRSSLMVEDHR